ncbi:hypothetical protein B0H66DRAFT_167723 [Apodospora peruviana]|uniref:Transcription factor TFIIIC triple barrel domain-containing protein n=1 Tax=Apodospora peruviana TaxID=516989 RepID=A0AAE0IKH0_9PEZI|nr:hypothetical protein B0H66DRAFT_167723 [Apodospora peruviana]
MDDEDEWEYEYSATERETYYLTLDLSIRDFLERKTEDVVSNTRSGYRVWYNPLFNAPDQRLEDMQDGARPDRELNELDNIGIPDEQPEPPIDPLLEQHTKANTNSAEANKYTVEEIQILDLHSKEPVVSYRNHVFRGTWCENIGTEMIFTKHDESNPLPVVRDLGRNFDLLAASAARVNFKEVTLASKEDLQKMNTVEETLDSYDTADDIPERYKRNGGIYVHVGGDKSGQRQPQAHFLEDLIALKRKRGETDEVTIQPLETKHNKLMVDDVEEERRRRKLQTDYERNLRLRHHRRADEDSSLSVEELYIARQRTHPEPSAAGRPRARRGGPGSRPRVRRPLLVRRQSPAGTHQSQNAEGTVTSTPTPARWDDLPGHSQGG